ncbi:MAG: thioredoxin family protein [Gemmataceae bacterium]
MSYRCALVPLLFLAVSSPLPAQELRWRDDFAAARREAESTGRPMLVDFGTVNCIWCRRLDATTFRDPGVRALLTERFVPVKVDADRDPRLAQKYGVTAFPTLAIVAADGTLLDRHNGYADAAGLTQFVERTLARLPAKRVAAADGWQLALDCLGEQIGELYLKRGRDRLRAGDAAGAAEWLAKAERQCPGTATARTAHDLLARRSDALAGTRPPGPTFRGQSQ